MPSLSANGNTWVANVLSYARYEFGGNKSKNKLDSPQVLSKEVSLIRKETATRNKPWTIDELKQVKEAAIPLQKDPMKK